MANNANPIQMCLRSRVQLLEDERDILRSALLTVMENNRMLREQLIELGVEDPYQTENVSVEIDVKAWRSH